MEPVVSIGKAATIIGVSPKTLREWEAKGKLKPQRDWKRYRWYNAEDLETCRRLLAEIKPTGRPKGTGKDNGT